MRSTWSEPYLWVHLAGIAAVPIFLELCLLGIAASESLLPSSLVFLLVAAFGIGPIVWMQWQRPFCIFSLVLLALQPNVLSDSQRQILSQFKVPLTRVVTVITVIVALLLLWQLNRWVPLVALKAAIIPGGALGGFLVACLAFLLTNLFLQVPASVLLVLLTPETQVAAAAPYPVAQIPQDFTLIGLRVKQILPLVVASPQVTSPQVASPQVASPQVASSPAVATSQTATAAPTAAPEVVSEQTEQISSLEPELEAIATPAPEEISEPLAANSLTQPATGSTEPEIAEIEDTEDFEATDTTSDLSPDLEAAISEPIEAAFEQEAVVDQFDRTESALELADSEAEIAAFQETSTEISDLEIADREIADREAAEAEPIDPELIEPESAELESAEPTTTAPTEAAPTEAADDFNFEDFDPEAVDRSESDAAEPTTDIFAPIESSTHTEPESVTAAPTEASENFEATENAVSATRSPDAITQLAAADIFPLTDEDLTEPEPDSTEAASAIAPEPEPEPIVRPAPEPKAEPEPFSFRLEIVTPPNAADTIVRIDLTDASEAALPEIEPTEETNQPDRPVTVEDTIVRIELNRPDQSPEPPNDQDS